jgi:hypothetical protein
VAIIGLYVDDCLILTHAELLNGTKEVLSSRFPVKDLREPTSILGIEILRDRAWGILELRQSGHIATVLAKATLSDCKPVNTPMTPGLHLEKVNETLSDCKDLPYQQVVGSLLYIACATRWDIAYAVGYLCRFVNAFNEMHWKAVKHLLRYLLGSRHWTISYHHDVNEPLTIIAYTDSNWGEDWVDCKSISLNLFLLVGGPISWSSKKQSSVSTSSCEAELLALSKVMLHALYLRRFFAPLRINKTKPTLILCNSQSANAVAEWEQRQIFHSRLKHLNICHLHIADNIAKKVIVVDYCPTDKMLADLLTKALPRSRLNKLDAVLRLVNRPSTSIGRVLESLTERLRRSETRKATRGGPTLPALPIQQLW